MLCTNNKRDAQDRCIRGGTGGSPTGKYMLRFLDNQLFAGFPPFISSRKYECVKIDASLSSDVQDQEDKELMLRRNPVIGITGICIREERRGYLLDDYLDGRDFEKKKWSHTGYMS